MADISILSRLILGVQRNVDVSQNALVVGSLKVGSVTPTELTKAILDNLLPLQNGTDFATGTNAHTHDGRYFTETELQSNTDGASGASKIGIDVTPAFSNFTPSANTVQGALEGIDSALSSAGNEKSDSVFRIVDNGDATKKIAFEASAITTGTTRTITMPDSAVDLGKIGTAIQKDGSIAFTANQPLAGFKLTGLGAGTSAGDSVRYEQAILASGANAFSANQSMGGNKLTSLGAPTANGDALRFDQLGASGGIATLDGGGKIPVSQLPSAVMTFEGIWNASTNSPALVDGTGDPGMVYLVTVAGTQDLGSGSQTFAPGDWVVANSSTIWQKSINSNAVVSVNGATGVVSVNAINELTGDVTTSAATQSQSKVATIANDAITTVKILNAAVTLAKLAADSVDENKIAASSFNAAGAITGGGGSKLAVQVDASTIEIASNALRVKDAGITLAKLASLSVDENKLTASVAGNGLTGGAGSALAVGANADGSIISNANDIQVAHAPAVKSAVEVAGEAFAATSLFAVRYGQNAETAGRVYKADKDATSTDNFYAVALVKTSGALSAADPMPAITKAGLITATAHGFTVGKPLFLDASGALSSTAPSTANHAVVRVGMVKDANTIDINIQVMGVN